MPSKPRLDNKRAYLSPYTQDGVVMAEWVDKSINAKMGPKIGKYTGTHEGQQLMEVML
jgi:hypothetical protein